MRIRQFLCCMLYTYIVFYQAAGVAGHNSESTGLPMIIPLMLLPFMDHLNYPENDSVFVKSSGAVYFSGKEISGKGNTVCSFDTHQEIWCCQCSEGITQAEFKPEGRDRFSFMEAETVLISHESIHEDRLDPVEFSYPESGGREMVKIISEGSQRHRDIIEESKARKIWLLEQVDELDPDRQESRVELMLLPYGREEHRESDSLTSLFDEGEGEPDDLYDHHITNDSSELNEMKFILGSKKSVCISPDRSETECHDYWAENTDGNDSDKEGEEEGEEGEEEGEEGEGGGEGEGEGEGEGGGEEGEEERITTEDQPSPDSRTQAAGRKRKAPEDGDKEESRAKRRNKRERDRTQGLNALFDKLRSNFPMPGEVKLSKRETLRCAIDEIRELRRLLASLQPLPQPYPPQPYPPQLYPPQSLYQPPSQPLYQPPSQPLYQPPSQPLYQPPPQSLYQPPSQLSHFHHPEQ